LVNVDFEFFDPNPDIDYHAVKNLARQLFQDDAESLNVGGLADLMLNQKLLGSTVKTDGRESDPYAFLTVLNLHQHKDQPPIRTLIDYVIAKSATNSSFPPTLQNILGPASANNNVGFIFSERLVNMPVQVIPPMYKMLADEMQWANDENEPYIFSHYLFITRTITYTSEDLDVDDVQPSKKTKKKSTSSKGPTTSSFHPEDEIIQRCAAITIDYPFANTPPRDSDSFGLPQAGRMMLVPAARFEQLVTQMQEAFASSVSMSM